MKLTTVSALSAAVVAAMSVSTFAAAFTPGDLVIYRVGDGTNALANTGNAVFLDEYSPSGSLVQSIAVPTTDAAASAGHSLIASGTATSEGLLTLSPNGQFLALTGYDVPLNPDGTSTATSSIVAGTAARTIGIVNSAGSVDTTTALTNYASGNNPRSAVTSDGSTIYAAGAAGGVIMTTKGSTGTSDTSISTTVANLRQLNIFGGQLYVSTSSGTAVRLGTVGTGLPSATGQTITNLPGIPIGTTSTEVDSPYDYFFATLKAGDTSPDTLYIADDFGGGTTVGDIEKFSLVSGSWVSNGEIAALDVRGITGSVSGSTVNLFATTGNSLYSLSDSSGFNATITGTANVIASAATGEQFRGVAFAPVSAPEPAALGAIALAALMAMRRRQS
jgi:MYXO-CTERM domain-containing protein